MREDPPDVRGERDGHRCGSRWTRLRSATSDHDGAQVSEGIDHRLDVGAVPCARELPKPRRQLTEAGLLERGGEVSGEHALDPSCGEPVPLALGKLDEVRDWIGAEALETVIHVPMVSRNSAMRPRVELASQLPDGFCHRGTVGTFLLSPVACAMFTNVTPARSTPGSTNTTSARVEQDDDEDEPSTKPSVDPKTVDRSWPASRGRALVDPGPPEPDWAVAHLPVRRGEGHHALRARGEHGLREPLCGIGCQDGFSCLAGKCVR
jgi:hypothetical protein